MGRKHVRSDTRTPVPHLKSLLMYLRELRVDISPVRAKTLHRLPWRTELNYLYIRIESGYCSVPSICNTSKVRSDNSKFAVDTDSSTFLLHVNAAFSCARRCTKPPTEQCSVRFPCTFLVYGKRSILVRWILHEAYHGIMQCQISDSSSCPFALAVKPCSECHPCVDTYFKKARIEHEVSFKDLTTS